MGYEILFIIDELEYKWFEFNKLVTNFWFIKELLERKINVKVATKRNLFIQEGQAFSICNCAQIVPNCEISYTQEKIVKKIEEFDAVIFRPDPPVDVDYINACNVFEFVDRKKVRLINDPLSIRNFNEKMHVNLFPEFSPKNIVTSEKSLILDFVNKAEKAVIKPLNRCFGSGVFVLQKGDANLSSIISSATENGKTLVMVQKYLDGAVLGDKRVMIINGEVLDECVRKLPAPNDFKFAEHSDKYFEKVSLSLEEKQVAQCIASKLKELGLPLAGLDMIDAKVIEINVTSPCYFIKEVNELYGTNFEKKIMPKLLALCGIEDCVAIV